LICDGAIFRSVVGSSGAGLAGGVALPSATAPLDAAFVGPVVRAIGIAESREQLTANTIAAHRPESGGRAGNSMNFQINGKPSLENPPTDLRVAQSVPSREFTVTRAWNARAEHKPQSYATEKITLGGGTKPAPTVDNGAKP
jgi:hypothetical protein